MVKQEHTTEEKVVGTPKSSLGHERHDSRSSRNGVKLTSTNHHFERNFGTEPTRPKQFDWMHMATQITGDIINYF